MNKLSLKQEKLAALLLYLKKNKSVLKSDLDKIELNYDDVKEYITKKLGIQIIESRTDEFKLDTKIDFKLYPDIPPEYTENVKKILEEADLIIDDTDSLEIIYYIPKKKETQYGCLCCPLPLCKTYPEQIDTPNSTDRNASRVCPNNAISTEGYPTRITIDERSCFGCYICEKRCPVNAIEIVNGKAKVRKRKNDSEYHRIKKQNRKNAEEDFLLKIRDININYDTSDERVQIEKDLLDRIGPNGFNLLQDPFYTWCRNVFRYMNKNIRYSGGMGMKTRADLIMDSPLFVFEVKTPAEGAPKKAVRQVDDSATQIFEKKREIAGKGIICWKPTQDLLSAVDQKQKYMEASGVSNYRIIVIPTHMMIYLFLLYRDEIISTELIDEILNTHSDLNKNKLKDIINKTKKISSSNKQTIIYEIEELKESYY